MHVFWWGCVGSISVEVIEIFQYYRSDPIKFPARYQKFLYYIIRILVACIAGCVVIALEAQNAKAAIGLGAAAPLIIDKFSQIRDSINNHPL